MVVLEFLQQLAAWSQLHGSLAGRFPGQPEQGPLPAVCRHPARMSVKLRREMSPLYKDRKTHDRGKRAETMLDAVTVTVSCVVALTILHTAH